MRFLLGVLAFVTVWISSALAVASAAISRDKNISDAGVPLYINSEMALWLGGIIYLLVFEVAIWGMQKTIGKQTRFLQWFWIVPLLLWSPIHFWILFIFTSF